MREKLVKAQNEVKDVFANPSTGEMQAYNCATQAHFISDLCVKLELENNPKHAKMLAALKKVAPSCDTIFELTNNPHGADLKLEAQERYQDAIKRHAIEEFFRQKPNSDIEK